MNTFSLTNRSGGRYWYHKVIRALLPWRFRRMLVLSGAYGLISSMESALHGHAQELSEVLRLSRDPQTVEVPIALHSILVSKFNNLNIEVQGKVITLREAATRTLTKEERSELSRAMAENVSPALCYSNLSCMAEDIFRLLGFVAAKRTQAV